MQVVVLVDMNHLLDKGSRDITGTELDDKDHYLIHKWKYDHHTHFSWLGQLHI